MPPAQDPQATPLEVPPANTMSLPPKRGAGKTFLVVLVIVALVLASVGGVYYFMNQKSKQQQAALQSQVNDLNNQIQDLQSKNKTLQNQINVDLDTQVAINKAIKGFYDDWIKGANANPPVAKNTLASQAINKGYINATVQSYINKSNGNPDPATCAATTVKSYQYTELTKDNNTSTATVNFDLNNGDKSKAKLNLIPQGSTWVISQITCG
ncbi:DUF3828 domain-containing protein [Candidatus Saccharibacteria bacterium]|nr:DUF3828 domain-containing protein [Candidatus Saccharibacteria bacterium]